MPNLAEAVFSLYAERPNVAVLMSGTGSNALQIVKNEELRDLYNITTIVTDNSDSNAATIAQKFSLDLVEKHAGHFSSGNQRWSYFNGLSYSLHSKGIKAAFYAGFMKIVSPSFIEEFPGVNVHPADLRILGTNGIAKYRGMKAMSQMRQELGLVRSSVHIVDDPVDTGKVISVSEPIYPLASQSDNEVHDILKSMEHYAFPETLRLLGKGLLDLSAIPIVIREGSRL